MRFGLIGSGLAGPLFGGALAARPAGASLAGIATSRPETARAAAERWGADRAYDSWQELVAAPEIDAVCVAVPTGLHAEVTIAAARAGKHVLVEKPIATCLDDADRMIAAAREAGVTLGVIFMYRFMDTARLMKRAIDEGHLGVPLLGEVAGRFWRDQRYYDSGAWRGTWEGEGGGSLMSQTSHTLDLLLWMLGPVRSVSAQVERTAVHDIDTEDLVAATLRFTSGAIGTVLSTTAARAPQPRTLAITGSSGFVELVGDDLGRFDAPALEADAQALRAAVPQDRGDTTRGAGFVDSELHRRQIEDFVLAAQAGREPMVDGAEGRRTLEVMRAIYRSAQTGSVVELPVGADPTPLPQTR
jgi:predicted dehydrogenase